MEISLMLSLIVFQNISQIKDLSSLKEKGNHEAVHYPHCIGRQRL
jgi:hypothetical protein